MRCNDIMKPRIPTKESWQKFWNKYLKITTKKKGEPCKKP